MGWQNGANYWKGAWANKGKGSGNAGGKSNKGKSAQQQKGSKHKENDAKDEALFPAYDKMPKEVADGSSSASSSQPSDALRLVVKALAESSQIPLPPEALRLLEDDAQDGLKTELKKTQQVLNKKRKIHSRLLRLKESLETKHKQFQAFKETMRDQLLEQQERYEEDVRNLEASIKETQEQLREMEEGDIENKDAVMEEQKVNPVETEDLLDTKKETIRSTAKEISLEEQLKTSRKETALTKQMFNNQAQQLQMYMQRLEQMQCSIMGIHGSTAAIGTPTPFEQDGAVKSPQLTRTPLIQPRKRDPNPALPPTDVKKQRQESHPVHLVEDSPTKKAPQEELD